MSTTKTILCLANSRKLHGRCVAGMVLENNDFVGWLRPISKREDHSVSEYERQYKDGRDPRVLDIIEVPLIEPRPHNYQQENWLLDETKYWRKVGRFRWIDLQKAAKRSGLLWQNGHKTYHGINDRIPLEKAAEEKTSLVLVRVTRVLLSVFAPSAKFGNPKRRVLAKFKFSGITYKLRVTDPIIERRYLARPDGTFELGECFLTISLGEPFNNHCYKLVAAILEKPK